MRVEVWSDVVCPWCYIGKRRLERAIEGHEGEVDVLWRSFELDPSSPTEPSGPLDEELAAKYGTTLEGARDMLERMTRAGAEEGLELNFDRARRGNTLDAHRVLHYGAAHGVRHELKERLFRAYMTEGRPISDRAELARLAADVGLDAGAVRRMLDTDELVDEVRLDEARAREIGIRGVPFFLVEGRLGVSGAQPPEILREALRRAGETGP